MKRITVILIAVAAMAVGQKAEAAFITGAISISGSVVPVDATTGTPVALGSATGLDFTTGSAIPDPGINGTFIVNTRTGSFVVIPVFSFGSIIDLSISGVTVGSYAGVPLAMFQTASAGFQFDLTTLVVTQHTATQLDLFGTGTMYLNGFDPTPGIFLYSNQGTQGSFSFSATDATVPEPGTLVLMGLGLVGIATAARRMRRA